MRPSESNIETKLHECSDCGWRTDDPHGRTCDRCGGELLHIGRPRDF